MNWTKPLPDPLESYSPWSPCMVNHNLKVPMKWKIKVLKNREIWKAFKSEEEWCFPFCHISSRSRDIQDFSSLLRAFQIRLFFQYLNFSFHRHFKLRLIKIMYNHSIYVLYFLNSKDLQKTLQKSYGRPVVSLWHGPKIGPKGANSHKFLEFQCQNIPLSHLQTGCCMNACTMAFIFKQDPKVHTTSSCTCFKLAVSNKSEMLQNWF
mgnify:CR=1 FL=1